MLLKEFNYNEYILSVNDKGSIFLHKNVSGFGYIDIADVPIINELMKELIEYYAKWWLINVSPSLRI